MQDEFGQENRLHPGVNFVDSARYTLPSYSLKLNHWNWSENSGWCGLNAVRTGAEAPTIQFVMLISII